MTRFVLAFAACVLLLTVAAKTADACPPDQAVTAQALAALEARLAAMERHLAAPPPSYAPGPSYGCYGGAPAYAPPPPPPSCGAAYAAAPPPVNGYSSYSYSASTYAAPSFAEPLPVLQAPMVSYLNGLSYQSAASFLTTRYGAAFAPGLLARYYAPARFFDPGRRFYGVGVGRVGFAPVAPVIAPFGGVNVTVGRGLFGRRFTNVQVGAAGGVNVNVGRRGLFGRRFR